jgi:UDP-N-acetylmuramoyl-tripeptide--D-alanyl-D-alanine ligase
MPGDIKELCDIVGPNISVLTGITLQHLERFKNLDNIIDAKFEILEALRENDFAVVDSSTHGVKK